MHLDHAPAMHEHLASLTQDLGEDVAIDIVRTFLTDLEPRLRELTEARDAGDAELVRRAAHTLKSTARLVGADDLASAAEAVEHEVGDVEAVRAAARPSARDLRRWLASRHG